MGRGFIKFYRDIQEHWIWQDKPYAKGQAWMDLLMMANFAETKRERFGQIVTVERGQIITSEQALADKWGWTRRKVQRFLERLEADAMLTRKGSALGSTITIVNYSIYQGKGTTDGSASEQREGNECAHNKKERIEEGKNLRNTNNLLTDNISDTEYICEPSAQTPTPEAKPKSNKKKANITIDELIPMVNEKNYPNELKEMLTTWLKYRVEIKDPVKSPTSFSRTLSRVDKAVAKYGEKALIDLIDYGIGKEWHGIIFERLEEGGAKNDRRGDGEKVGGTESTARGEPEYGTVEYYKSIGWKA